MSTDPVVKSKAWKIITDLVYDGEEIVKDMEKVQRDFEVQATEFREHADNYEFAAGRIEDFRHSVLGVLQWLEYMIDADTKRELHNYEQELSLQVKDLLKTVNDEETWVMNYDEYGENQYIRQVNIENLEKLVKDIFKMMEDMDVVAELERIIDPEIDYR